MKQSTEKIKFEETFKKMFPEYFDVNIIKKTTKHLQHY